MARSRLTEILLIVVAVLLPLAGVVLAVIEGTQGDRALALRIAAATVLGVFLYLLVFG